MLCAARGFTGGDGAQALQARLADVLAHPRAPDAANPLEKMMKKEAGDAPPAAPPS